MLSIEYVITHGRADPVVVYRSDTRSRTLGVAEQVAHGTLDAVRRMFPTTPPDGFQIFDDNDDLIFRSWENVPLHSGIIERLQLEESTS
jgi:hypothetical protein